MIESELELSKDLATGMALGYFMVWVMNAHQHREMSHMHRLRTVVREAARIITWLFVGSDSRIFAANHVMHHYYAGTAKDPHPTEMLGPAKVFFGTPYYNAQARKNLQAELEDEEAFRHRGGDDDPAFRRREDGSLELRPHPLDPLLKHSKLGLFAAAGPVR